jgi:peptidoglycan lytic transglycosylase
MKKRGGRLLAAALAAFSIPTAAALAAGESDVQTSGGTTAAPVERVAVAASLSRSARHVRAGARVRVTGSLNPGLPGRRVGLQVRTARGWKTVDGARTRAGGRFRAVWRPRSAGSYRVRVKLAGRAAAERIGRVHAYRPAIASWYGPGFYGNRTACGKTLGAGTLGVAHRTLPCGTRLRVRLGSRSVAVRVIDRGPFHYGREFDLTGAVKQRIGFGSTGRVWVTR